MTKSNTKLIEVALPLKAINTASAREKSIRHGHPSTLHLWWARRPLAAARAVIFAQMVDDPSAHPEIFKTEESQDKERRRLFRIIEDLVLWENTKNEKLLQQAHDEILRSWVYTCADNADDPRASELYDRSVLPGFHDPFAGGGALPIEAQRLGLDTYASDLNPVAVLINKAIIEIPPLFADDSPVNPEVEMNRDLAGREWRGAEGLAEDVRYYGQWVRDEAEKRIGHFYPKVEITAPMVHERPDLKKYEGQKLTVIACLWARTVKSPNPAFANVEVPLASTFIISSKSNKEAFIEPVVEGDKYRFVVKVGKPKDINAAKLGTSAGKRAGFLCLMSGTPLPYSYIRDEGTAGRMGLRLMAVVAEGARSRVYLTPTKEMESAAQNAKPHWAPDAPLHGKCRVNVSNYGMNVYGDLFTPRQLLALATFSDLVQEARNRLKLDASKIGLLDDGKPLEEGGIGATAYADAIAMYLGLAVSRSANTINAHAVWSQSREQSVNLFSRQAIPMAWDFPEVNPFAGAAGDFAATTLSMGKTISGASSNFASAVQADAQKQEISKLKVISTDPPYYDNIAYADLSDFFYVWLRRSLKPTFPSLFTTLAVPKTEELVATPYRHDNKEQAEEYFLTGMTQAMKRLADQAHPAFPVTIYYAFKQGESSDADGTTNTGWDTFLAAVIEAGFSITGTWPMRTERPTGVKASLNALASSIILVCRRQSENAPAVTRREFIAQLRAELPEALAHLQTSNIAPVDLAQAAIGPGMAVYTRFSKVVDADGHSLSVRAALALINQTLDEALAEQEGDFDVDTRWALTWFEQMGFAEGDYGVAEQLSKSKNTSVSGLMDAGILVSKAGKVRLLMPAELPSGWDPSADSRLTVWEMVHHLIGILEQDGEAAAAALVTKLGSHAETARELCYRLYTSCERNKRASEAMAYNGLVQSWPEITRLVQEAPKTAVTGTNEMFDQE
jgi:putative DNA methylase